MTIDKITITMMIVIYIWYFQTYDPCVTPLEVNPLGLLGTQSESAISRHEITKGERLFYGAHMGSETRNVEFKRGGGQGHRI